MTDRSIWPIPPIVRQLDAHAAAGDSRHLTSGEVAAVSGYISRLRDALELDAAGRARPIEGDTRSRPAAYQVPR